jgi:pyridoxal biosynthesis lyase PdxS
MTVAWLASIASMGYHCFDDIVITYQIDMYAITCDARVTLVVACAILQHLMMAARTGGEIGPAHPSLILNRGCAGIFFVSGSDIVALY